MSQSLLAMQCIESFNQIRKQFRVSSLIALISRIVFFFFDFFDYNVIFVNLLVIIYEPITDVLP